MYGPTLGLTCSVLWVEFFRYRFRHALLYYYSNLETTIPQPEPVSPPPPPPSLLVSIHIFLIFTMSSYPALESQTDFTDLVHSQPYPFISPTRKELSAAGKNIIVTGGGTKR